MTVGVIIPKDVDAILLLGPEAEPFAKIRSTIKKIRKLIKYKENTEPGYPDIPITNFKEVFYEM